MSKYMGHSPSKERNDGVWQTLKEHVEGVTERTEAHVNYLAQHIPEITTYAKLAGYLHDLGKYRDDFQMYRLKWHPHEEREDLTLEEKAVPHSDAGAKWLDVRIRLKPKEKFGPAEREDRRELAFVIASHHGALRDIEGLDTRLSETKWEEVSPLIRKAVTDIPELADLLRSELPQLPLKDTERAFLIRTLFSALVDADRLDTESHGSPGKTELRAAHAAEKAEMAQLLARVQAEMDKKAAADALNPQPINALRREMYASALEHAADAPGFFRLTMPTGGGKTLTSLAFALKHAELHGLRRVIYGVPFTTIIDQTARDFRRVLERKGEFKVLEHHSSLEPEQRKKEGQENQTTAGELATENWDAAVIVTTTVRLFQETLFGTRTAQLRRLHNVTGSVIVLDEAQSLPAHLLRPTLDALQFLVKYGGCSVVLCTATQPALNESLGFPALKNIRDLVPDAARFFDELKRVEYRFRVNEPTPWSALATELNSLPQVLCIVNTRQHAADLFEQLGLGLGHFHLSTNLCPHHRKRVLAVMRDRLKKGKVCRVISTQLIEAGIDVDFPQVYRAMGPLEAIVQAAGRCNREGKLEQGVVTVFLPETDNLPKGDYRVRRDLTVTALKESRNLHDPGIFTDYFAGVYRRVSDAPKVKIAELEKDFQDAHAGLYFEQVAQAYQMIEGDLIPVIIRGYRPLEVDRLLKTIQSPPSKKVSREAWRALQQYTISVYAHQAAKLGHLLTEVPELVTRANWLGIELPRIRQWPITARYDAKLGVVSDLAGDAFTSL